MTLPIDPVAANELITAAWGNDVANACNTELVRVAGDTITGNLNLSNPPTNANHAVRKSWVESVLGDYLPKSGGGMGGDLNMNSNLIIGLGNPSLGGHAANKTYVDTKLDRGSGGAMGGDIDMNGHSIVGLPDATADGHAARKKYVDDKITPLASSKLDRDGDPGMTGDLKMQGNKIVGLANPSAGDEAVNVNYADAHYDAKSSSDPRLKEVDGPITDAVDRVRQLAGKAFRGHWKDDLAEVQWDMLASTDIAEVAPYAVEGEPDAVDSDGRVKPQTVDFRALVPLLVSALGEALDRIEQLEADRG